MWLYLCVQILNCFVNRAVVSVNNENDPKDVFVLVVS